MSTLEIIIIVGVVLFGIFIYIKAFKVFCFIEEACETVLIPIIALENLILGLCKPKILSRVIMVLTILASTAYVIISYVRMGSIQAFGNAVLSGTAIGGFLSLSNEGFSFAGSFSLAALVGIGLSSFLAVLYMKFTVEALDKTNPVNWILIVVCNIVFTCMCTLLAGPLEQLCSSGAAYILSLYHQLADFFTSGQTGTLWGLIKTIGTGLFLLVLLYLGLSAFVIALREYLGTLLYGILTLAVTIACGLICVIWLKLPDFTVAIFFIAALLITEYIRANESAKRAFVSFMDNFS